MPGWSKFYLVNNESNILLTGVPDEILKHPERGLWIGDYNTAPLTDAQDELAPMYEIQLNCYALIAETIGLGAVYGLGLLYFEPITGFGEDNPDLLVRDDSFFPRFAPKLKPVKMDLKRIPPLLETVRKICDIPRCPAGRVNCVEFQSDRPVGSNTTIFGAKWESKVRPTPSFQSRRIEDNQTAGNVAVIVGCVGIDTVPDWNVHS